MKYKASFCLWCTFSPGIHTILSLERNLQIIYFYPSNLYIRKLRPERWKVLINLHNQSNALKEYARMKHLEAVEQPVSPWNNDVRQRIKHAAGGGERWRPC